MIVNKELAGGDPTPLNWIDPTPLDETDNQGKVLGDQILRVGEYFIVTGSYKVLKLINQVMVFMFKSDLVEHG